MLGYLQDPKLGQKYMDIATSLAFSEEVARDSEWVTRKRLKEDYDSSEVEEMIDDGIVKAYCFSFRVRHSPVLPIQRRNQGKNEKQQPQIQAASPSKPYIHWYIHVR